MLYYLYHSERRGAETDNRITVGHFYLLSSHRYFPVIGRWVLDPSIFNCKPGLSLEGMFLFLLPLPCSGGAIKELHVATQGSENLYLQVGDGFGRSCQGGCGHGAIEQRVGWVAARRVCSLPVGLQVFSQVFTRILQLILI